MGIGRGARLGYVRRKGLFVPRTVSGGGGSAPISYSTAVAADSPTAFWVFTEDPLSGTIDDLSGNGYVLTVGNQVTHDTGAPFGTSGSASCSGLSGSYFYRVDNDTVFSAADFTAEAWVKATDFSSGAVQVIQGKTRPGTSGANEWQFSLTATGAVLLLIGDTSGGTYRSFTTDSVISDTAWHHVAASYNDTSGAGVVYIDGAPITTTDAGPTGSRQGNTATDYHWAKNANNGEIYAGLIYGGAYFSSVLTDSQIAHHAAASQE